MCFQLRHGVELALELLLRQQRVNLGVTWATDANDLPHNLALEVAFIALVVMPRARDQVMASQRFAATADRAISLHRGSGFAAPIREGQLCDAGFIEVAKPFGDHPLVLRRGSTGQRQV